MTKCRNQKCDVLKLPHHNSKFCSNECLKEHGTKVHIDRSVEKYPDGSDHAECHICGFRALNLQVHVQSKHNMISSDYREQYNTHTLSPKKIKDASKKFTGENNPGFNHGGKLSPWSELSGRSAEQILISKERAKEDRYNPTQLEYWLGKGYSETDAIKLRKERQTTFSLEICINELGTEAGTERWNERQELWLGKLDDKPQAEKDRINRSKLSSGCNISKAETEIFNEVKKRYNNATHQFTIPQGKGYVYDIHCNNNIIEYNGDFWHMNPKTYNESDINAVSKISGKDKWEYDRNKNEYAESAGYRILVVWERDYKKDKCKVIQECLDFLKGV